MSAATRTLIERFVPVSALRTREPGAAVRVTSTELFFDLVYVFSIIQLSHFLLEHQSAIGALQAATLFAAVWVGLELHRVGRELARSGPPGRARPDDCS